MIDLSSVVSGILFGGIYGVFAVGLSLLLGVMRVVNIAHGAVVAVSALSVVSIAGATHWNWLLLVAIGGGIGAVLGLPLELAVIRPFRRLALSREDLEHGTLLASLALLFIANALLVYYTQARAFSYPLYSFPTGLITLAGTTLNEIYYINFAIGVVLVVVLELVVRKTQVGRGIRAIASDYRAARLLGINVNKFSLGVSMVSCGFAGIAGVLLSMAFNVASSDFGETFLFLGFVIVVIGGIGSIAGTFIAAIAISIVMNVVSYHTGGSWGEAVVFGILMIFLIVRPEGLFGRGEVIRA